MRTLEQNAREIVHRWQYVIDKLSNNVFFMVVLSRVVNPVQANATTIQASFNSLYLGGIEGSMPMMDAKFPDLGLKRENCVEMSWVKPILYFVGNPLDAPLESLLDRTIFATRSTKFIGKFKASRSETSSSPRGDCFIGWRWRWLFGRRDVRLGYGDFSKPRISPN
ncbi:unnamed protein product [Linum tenue]|uniref:Uncharacterized protein n=1 Tax=Linum tenue TaxID=586396 RepID=A0AAV0LCG2_9ROSI|nr:unnamed protein product [Linum tenue]